MFRRKIFRSLLSVFCIASIVMFSTQALARSESEIKALYLFNFIKFVEWPQEEEQSEIPICILGDNPFSSLTEKLNSLSVRDKNIRVVELSEKNYSGCALLYISTSESNFYRGVVDALNDTPVLTVSDIEEFADNGGMIGFIKAGNVVRFDINLKQAREAKLEISAKLLKLANKVEQ